MNVLIGIPSPRDIPEFKEAIDKIKQSKLWVKYVDEYTAYYIIREMFLEYDFSHLCIIPDDLIVTPEQFEKLKLEAENYPVLSGTFPIYSDDPTTLVTIMNSSRITKEGQRTKLGEYNDIQKVYFEGFACCFITRDVIKKIRFDCEYGFDKYFADQCKEKNIPINVDFSVVLNHIRKSWTGNLEKSGIGLKRPTITLE